MTIRFRPLRALGIRATAIAGLIQSGCIVLAAPAHAAEVDAKVDFSRDVRPLLSNNCFKCHGPDAAERQAAMRLDLREEALAPTESGSTPIVPGNSAESELVHRIFSTEEDTVMPPPDSGKKLSEADKELLRRWIDEGADWRQHWSFVPPVRPPLPQVANAAWPRGQIDRFILAGLEAEGLQAAPEADKPTLIRRVTLDLTGLPPTLEEIDAFLADESPGAYDKLVDRLLDSPRFGERMALEWLDAARYADTHGYHLDSGRDMWRWREWVIAAFNRNLPFDQFTIEQLAGDLLPEATLQQRIASGFNRNHMINFEGGAIPEEYLSNYIVDRVNTTGTVWMGLTIACTQCHDHKYDPLTQREYYQFYAFFHNVPEKGLDGSQGNASPAIKSPTPDQQQVLDQLSARIEPLRQRLNEDLPEVDAAQAAWEQVPREPGQLPENITEIVAIAAEARSDEQRGALRSYYREQVSPELKPLAEELAALRQAYAELDAQVPTTMVMQELETPRETFLLVRGQYDQRGERVEPGVPASLPPLAAAAPANRLGLAQWLVDSGHPLTARVIVNRYWQMVFGAGLVKTSEDFGSQGELPSHPELLDWLAREFVESGWNVKHMQRLLVTSATYRQSSAVTDELLSKDPENRLLARAARLRLPAEFIRDQALALAGLLDDRIGGPSVSPYQPAGLWEELTSREDSAKWTAQVYRQSHGADLYRRTMYTFWKRTSPPPTLATFDAPDRETCTVRRATTNTPLQALVLMNDPTYVEAARKLAERIMTEAGPTAEDRAAWAFRQATGRHPRDDELALVANVYREQSASYRADSDSALALLAVGESPRNEQLDVAELAAWTVVSSVMLNMDETITKN